eukprot:788999-Rhodomonas_salina.1
MPYEAHRQLPYPSGAFIGGYTGGRPGVTRCLSSAHLALLLMMLMLSSATDATKHARRQIAGGTSWSFGGSRARSSSSVCKRC